MRRVVHTAALAAVLAFALGAGFVGTASAAPLETVTEELCEMGGGDIVPAPSGLEGALCVGGTHDGADIASV